MKMTSLLKVEVKQVISKYKSSKFIKVKIEICEKYKNSLVKVS